MSITLKSDLNNITLRDFQVDSDYVDPTSANIFAQGQWWQLDPVNANHIVPVVAGNPTFAFPVWSKPGEGSTQVLDGQLTVLFLGQFDADTDQYDVLGVYTYGTALTVANGVLTPAVATDYVHAICSRPPDVNQNLLGFVRTLGATVV
jgi:hypothetical protein